MSNDEVIQVENLSKRYLVGHQGVSSGTKSFRELMSGFKGDVIRKTKELFQGTPLIQGDELEEFWALKDVSFNVKKGEVLGIIGKNGAGKSTLLKILSRITDPTSGKVRLRGRVASLLEVGTGFHVELSGRENIFLNGAILGMKRSEIRKKFDEIVAFAEVGKFIDTPVKRYSSGMYVRLAFAVAAHLEPEILIIDEVLAVGDIQFQRKCLGKVNEITKSEGRTVIFVSHQMDAISALTDRCVLLNGGKVAYLGETEVAIKNYLDLNYIGSAELIYQRKDQVTDRYSVYQVSVKSSEVPGVQAAGKPMQVEILLDLPRPAPFACISLQIVNQFYQPATHLWINGSDQSFGEKGGRVKLVCEIPALHLNVGQYTLKLSFKEPPGGEVYEVLEDICPFEVIKLNEYTQFGWHPESCIYHEPNEWSVEQINPSL